MDEAQEKIDFEYWEDDEFIITLNGKPIGQTLHKHNAFIVKDWLFTAINSIRIGYHKLPEGKPPLLDHADIATIWRQEKWRIGGDNPDPLENHQLELAVAQAQREADIKWYGGEND